MELRSATDVVSLPDGAITLIKDQHRIATLIDTGWATDAAEAVIKIGLTKNFRTKAEVIADAINVAGWGAGRSGYRAVVNEQYVPSIVLR